MTLLTPAHSETAAQTIAEDLRRHSAGMPPDVPQTWLTVAAALGVFCCEPYPPHRRRGYEHLESRGCLVFSDAIDRWVIQWNTGFPPAQQAAVLVHELAHWYQRTAESEWICGEPQVFWYEGPDDERHRIARAVEKMLLPSG